MIFRVISTLSAALGLSVLVLSSAQGHVISMETQVQTTVRENALDVQVRMTNRGDESAQSVYVKTELSASISTSPVVSSVAPGAHHTATAHFPLTGLASGRYPLIVTTHYADANGYPFSALTVTTFQRGLPAVPSIVGTLGSADLPGRAQITLSLKNLKEEPQILHVRLLTPEELSVDPAVATVTIPPRQESNVTFGLRNFSALPGSTYYISAIAEYEDGGVHSTVLAPATAHIGEPNLSSIVAPHAPILLIAVVVILILIGGRWYWEKRKSS